MQVTQTVNVPASHKLTIDVPPEIPSGRFTLTLNFTAEPSEEEKAERRAKALAAIEHCSGLFQRLGIDLSVDKFLELRKQDKELEDRLDAIHLEEHRRWGTQ